MGSLGDVKCPIKMANKGFTQTCHLVGAATRIRELQSWGPCCPPPPFMFLIIVIMFHVLFIQPTELVMNFFFLLIPRLVVTYGSDILEMKLETERTRPKAVNAKFWNIKTVNLCLLQIPFLRGPESHQESH